MIKHLLCPIIRIKRGRGGKAGGGGGGGVFKVIGDDEKQAVRWELMINQELQRLSASNEPLKLPDRISHTVGGRRRSVTLQ